MERLTTESDLKQLVETCLNQAFLRSQGVDEFIKTRIGPCPGGRFGNAAAYQAYLNYCAENRCDPVSAMAFAREMMSRFKDGRLADFQFYKDIRLIPYLAKESGSKQSGPDGEAAA